MNHASRLRLALAIAGVLLVAALVTGIRYFDGTTVDDRVAAPAVVDPTASVDEVRPTTPGIAEARRRLDDFDLAAAQTLLQTELTAHPDEPEGLLQLARLAVMVGDGEASLRILDRLGSTHPDYSEGYVLRAHVLQQVGRAAEAWRAVTRAEQMGSTSPWLDVNAAMLYREQKQFELAAGRCGRVVERYRGHEGGHEKVVAAAYFCRRDWLRHQRRLDDIEADYRAMLALDRVDPTFPESFAHFLCLERGRCAEALPLIEESLAIGESGHARKTKAFIQYSLWADHVAKGTGDSAEARRLFEEAQSVEPNLDAVMGQFGGKVDNAALVAALVDKGVSPDVFDTSSRLSALQTAGYVGDAKSVEVLVAAGADPNHSPQEWSPLMIAAKTNNVDVARALFAAGADKRSNPDSALWVAREYSSVAMLDLLMEEAMKDL